MSVTSVQEIEQKKALVLLYKNRRMRKQKTFSDFLHDLSASGR